MKKARIYTGTGDNGTTSLVGGTRVSKDNIRVETYGTLDELNAHIGLLAIALENEEQLAMLERIENNLFAIESSLATEGKPECMIPAEEITSLEKAMDRIEAELPPMKSFILPGGNEAAARANLCRTVCRRAERNITALSRETWIDPAIPVYVNRLSDYLFLLQRQLLDGEEKIWEKHCK